MNIANRFNSFFTNFGKNQNNAVNMPHNKSFKDYLKNDIIENSHFQNIDEENVSQLINNLSQNSSFGFDGISSKLQKLMKSAVIKPITIIINQMINTGIFPDKLKIAKIILFLKRMVKLNLLIIGQYLFYLQYPKYLKKIYLNSYINSFLIINYFMTVSMVSGKVTQLNMLH